ncbi:MAG: flagellar hook protein FlgE, partial [Rhodoferax sp.]|nr:flagellar hook protein FlgE [Rhodoferax sp.]
AEFGDLIASSLGASGVSNQAGIGVAVATIAQQFTQGNISTTGNSLDVAVNGNGFFQLTQPDGSTAYTRDGSFKLDKDGFVLTNTGANVMGYPTDRTGKATSVVVQKLQLPTSAPIPASATTTITAEFNLDARAPLASKVPITPITTYGTALTAYDSQGVGVPVSLYFVKVGPDFSTAPPVLTDAWDVFDASTVAIATSALAANSAALADPLNTATIATNTTQGLLHVANLAINKKWADLDAKNIALNSANAALDVKNTDLNTTNATTIGWANLPTYANGGLSLLPTKAADGLSTFTPPATGTIIPQISSDLKATFDNAGTGAFAAETQIPANAALTGTVASGKLFRMEFDTAGKLVPPTSPISLTLTSVNPNIGDFDATLDLSKATQFGSSFVVSNLAQDGYPPGELTGLSIGESGLISTRYSNGQTQSSGQISLADFRNIQALRPLGGNTWAETFASGSPVQGEPGSGKFGALHSGALEESNVDLTSELVNMMTAQRAYQANAQTIKTQDQILSTLVNLR